MNIFKAFFFRTLHFFEKLAGPLLPYRPPRALSSMEDAAKLLKGTRPLIVTGKTVSAHGLTRPLEEALRGAEIPFAICSETPSDPTVSAVERAFSVYRTEKCNAVVAVGGGSVIDCAKGIIARAMTGKDLQKLRGVMKVRGKAPLLLALPTTAGSGSEASVAAVFTDEAEKSKFTVLSFPLTPQYVLLAPELTLSLPSRITAETGMDALTHAVEAYLGRATTKATRALAESAVCRIYTSLPRAVETPLDLEARREMLIASFEAGKAFTVSYVGYVHALAHALGGAYRFPHGRCNAVLLPAVLRAYGKCARKKLARLARKCHLSEAREDEKAAEAFIGWIADMNRKTGIPEGLPFPEEDIPALAAHADREANPLYPVPKLMGREELGGLLRTIRTDG